MPATVRREPPSIIRHTETLVLDFTAIDFETANSKRASVCAVGATRVRDGRIVERFDQLVHPPLGYDEFNEWNIRVHHIHPEDVARSPSWPEVAPRLSAFIGNDILVAHNANFDSSVMVAACEATNLRWQVPQMVCTLELARTHLELPSYKLPRVSEELGLPKFTHHEAGADADAAAHVLIALAARLGATTVAEIQAAVPAGKSAGTRTLPDYIIPQARQIMAERGFIADLSELKHPDGRANNGEPCVVCGQPVPRKIHYTKRDRHTCSDKCDTSLKRRAQRALDKVMHDM